MTGLGVDGKKLIHLRHDPKRGLICGIEFDRIEELSPGMRPACRVHDLGSAHMIVNAVTVALESTLEVTQEPFGTLPFPTHPKIEHHWATRPAVLPEVSLVIFSPTIVHLHPHGRFIGLDIGTAH